MKEAQSTNTILMVRPANFGFNVETAENNVFQSTDTALSKEDIKKRAMSEFDRMVNKLKSHGVQIIVIDDTNTPLKTDAVFPNNWISTHENGSVFLFPMFSPNRRLERRIDIISKLKENYKLDIDTSLLSYEFDEKYLESTGSMILDRPNKIIYACYSVRTDQRALEEYGQAIGYKVIGFNAVDGNGIPYYHTNVIMTLGEHVCVICTESIVNDEERNLVLFHLKKTNKAIIDISRNQVLAYAGNMLEVQGNDKKKLLVMSDSALQSLKEEQLNIINNYNKIVSLELGTIEKFGGGSARCMMAEIFLPKAN